MIEVMIFIEFEIVSQIEVMIIIEVGQKSFEVVNYYVGNLRQMRNIFEDVKIVMKIIYVFVIESQREMKNVCDGEMIVVMIINEVVFVMSMKMICRGFEVGVIF